MRYVRYFLLYKKTCLNHVKPCQSLSLELSPGKMTALVGPSGGGKSSCVSLLQRFYEPQQGQVLLDNKPLHEYQPQYLCSQVKHCYTNTEWHEMTLVFSVCPNTLKTGVL